MLFKVRCVLGLYRDDGEENGNYYIIAGLYEPKAGALTSTRIFHRKGHKSMPLRQLNQRNLPEALDTDAQNLATLNAT